MPILFEARDALDALRAARVCAELGLASWLVGKGDEYKWTEEVAATRLPILLPLDFPDDPAPGEGDDLSLSLAALRHWDRAPDNPRALTSFRLGNPAKLHAQLAKAIARGLAPEEALAALTTTPAALLGIADRAGTIEPGKMANLVVVEGDLFVDKPKIREVWIDGRRYEVKASEPAEVDPAGTWEVTVVAGDEVIPVTLVITGAVSDLSGSIRAMGHDLPLASVDVSGKTLEVACDSTPLGLPGEVVMRLTIDGDAAKGSAESPQGPATLTATRTSKPIPEIGR
jgi:hypothetical protein